MCLFVALFVYSSYTTWPIATKFGRHVRMDAGVSWAYFFPQKNSPGLQGRGVKIPPKTHIALISPKIGVHVRMTWEMFWCYSFAEEKKVCQAYRGSNITPQKLIFVRSPPKLVCTCAQTPGMSWGFPSRKKICVHVRNCLRVTDTHSTGTCLVYKIYVDVAACDSKYS